MHMLIVWSALYLVWGLGLTPRWREYGTTMLTTVAWVAVASVFNAIAETNYGFLAARHAAPRSRLPRPWPWYIAVEVALVAVGWA